MKSAFLLMIIVSFCNFSFANGVFDRGNGGSGVRCNTSENSQLTVLDLYEMEQYSFTLARDIPKDFESAVEFVLKRIELYDPNTGREIRAASVIMKNELYFVHEPLNHIGDLGKDPELKPGCRVVQLAIQWDENSYIGRKFVISVATWNELDQVNKAALVIHELYYRVILKHKKKFNLAPLLLRQAVGFYFSDQFKP